MLESYRKNIEQVRQISHRVREVLDELASQAGDWAQALGLEDKRRTLERVGQDLEGRQDVILAVVGQIKTGKSTLLNALLFDGEEVLPAAASPKTARLTVIRAGDQRDGLARFYSRDEWAAIEKLAGEGDRVHAEIVEDARFQLDDAGIRSLLGREKSIGRDWDALNDYVAEDGRYANLVREVELTIPHAKLQGLTVVDTPGLDDPIEARERQTMDFLHKADAVIVVVSPSIRWLDARDLDLLLNQLGSGPLRHGAVVVVASRMDALDERQRGEWTAMKSRAAGVMEEQARRRGMDADVVIESIRRVFDPKAIVEVSALAHIIARWRQGAWVPSTGRARTLEQYEAMIAERWNLARSPDAFLDAAGVERLREQVESVVRARKSRILLGGAMGRIQELLIGLEQTMEQKREDATRNLEALEQGLEEYEEQLNREKAFLERIGSGMHRLRTGLVEIEQEMDDRFYDDRGRWLTRARLRAPDVKSGMAAVLSPESVRRQIMDQVEDIISDAVPVFRAYVTNAQKGFESLLSDLGLGQLSKDEADTLERLRFDIINVFATEIRAIRQNLDNIDPEELARDWTPDVPGFWSRLVSSGQQEYQEAADEYAAGVRKQTKEHLGKLYEAHARRAPKDAQAKVKDWLERRKREVEDHVRELTGHRDDALAERHRLEASARRSAALAESFQVKIAGLRQRLAGLERGLE